MASPGLLVEHSQPHRLLHLEVRLGGEAHVPLLPALPLVWGPVARDRRQGGQVTPLAEGLLAGAVVGILVGFSLRWMVDRLGRPRRRFGPSGGPPPPLHPNCRCVRWAVWRTNRDPRTSKAAKVAAGLALTQRVPRGDLPPYRSPHENLTYPFASIVPYSEGGATPQARPPKGRKE